jgi:hypothetical protein
MWYSPAVLSAKIEYQSSTTGLPKPADLQAFPPNGANRDRTGDLLLAKQALSQLSYGPFDPSIYALQSRFPIFAVASERRLRVA